jgi:hypothetical protein
MPFKKGQKRTQGSGRKRGVKNKKTITRTEEFRLISDRLLHDEDYLEKVVRRCKAGRAPQLEKYIWERNFGKSPLEIKVDEDTRDAAKSLAKALDSRIVGISSRIKKE